MHSYGYQKGERKKVIFFQNTLPFHERVSMETIRPERRSAVSALKSHQDIGQSAFRKESELLYESTRPSAGISKVYIIRARRKNRTASDGCSDKTAL